MFHGFMCSFHLTVQFLPPERSKDLDSIKRGGDQQNQYHSLIPPEVRCFRYVGPVIPHQEFGKGLYIPLRRPNMNETIISCKFVTL